MKTLKTRFYLHMINHINPADDMPFNMRMRTSRVIWEPIDDMIWDGLWSTIHPQLQEDYDDFL